MLHLDLIRCFSPGGRARALAKASLPFPTQLLPSSSVPPLLPSQGSSQGRIWGPTRPHYSPAAAGKRTAHAVVICEWANEQHTGMLYTKERESPCLKNRSLSWGKKVGIGKPGKPGWGAGLAPCAYPQSPAPEPRNAMCRGQALGRT